MTKSITQLPLGKPSASAEIPYMNDGVTSKSSAYDIAVAAFDPISGVPTRLDSRNNGASFLYRHAATSGTFREAWSVYSPVGSGWFTGAAFAQYWGGSLTEMTMGRLWLGKIGVYQHHTAAVKTGAGWQGRTWDYAYSGDLTLSTVAGDQISFSVTGAFLVLRSVTISNGGYAIVSIDGDWTAANRCATFTAADFSEGRCRSSDVGKRYISTYGGATCGWLDMPLADDLADSAHTVVFEATGTKPAASGDVRAHIGGVTGCSASHVSGSPGVAGHTIAHIEGGYDTVSGSSAFVVVPEIKNAAGSAFEFLGEPHAGATQTSWVITADGIDRTGMTVGTYQSASTLRLRRTSALASTDASGTVVAQKTTDVIAAGNGPCPIVSATQIKWSVDKEVRWAYAHMLPMTQLSPSDNTSQNTRFWKWSIQEGRYTNTAPLSANNGVDYGKLAARVIEARADNGRLAYAALLETDKSVRNFALSSAAAAFVADNASNEKAYFTRSETKSIELWAAGDVWQVFGGWGMLPSA